MDIFVSPLFILVFPLLLTIGTFTIPFVNYFGDHEAAEQGAKQQRRWFWGHLITAAAFGTGILTVTLLAIPLLQTEHAGWAFAAVLFAAVGGSLQAAGLGADGIGPVAMLRAQQPARLFFDGSSKLAPLTFILGSVGFGMGQIFLVIGLNHLPDVSTAVGVTTLIAAILFSALPAIPSSWSLYLTAVLSWLIYAPYVWWLI
ncbi:MAG: hypothetical protein KDE51_04135 [Anaerolineales bacterium]|nr:hypothetical protein [Anaerolineales bacterium]